jgi:hypothetical protein
MIFDRGFIFKPPLAWGDSSQYANPKQLLVVFLRILMGKQVLGMILSNKLAWDDCGRLVEPYFPLACWMVSMLLY